jgi:hypothetical protein
MLAAMSDEMDEGVESARREDDFFGRSPEFSGGDVARAQGDGFMFDAIWTFQISEDAE